jgi:WD40 repeat protein
VTARDRLPGSQLSVDDAEGRVGLPEQQFVVGGHRPKDARDERREKIRTMRYEAMRLPGVIFWAGEVLPGPYPTEVAVSPDGDLLAVRHGKPEIHLWDLSTHRRMHTLGGGYTVGPLVFTPDGNWLIAVGIAEDKGNTLCVWKVADGELIRSVDAGDWVRFVDVAADGKTVVTGAFKGILLWDSETWKLRKTISLPPRTDGSYYAVSADGRLAAMGLDKLGRLRPEQEVAGTIVLDLQTGEQRVRLPGYVSGLAMSADGEALAAISSDGTKVTIFDPATGKTKRSLVAEPGRATAVGFSPDGKLLAAGMSDGAILLIDVTTTQTVQRLTGHKAAVHSLAFSRDGRRLASGGSDRAAFVWSVAVGTASRAGTEDTTSDRTWRPDIQGKE